MNAPDITRRAATTLGLAALAGCAGPQLADHAGQRPAFDFRRYFDGDVRAHGIVSDRGGKVLRRFVVVMRCRWDGDAGTLDEDFAYDDGERQRRVWHVRRLADGRYTGTADDVVGQALGQSSGPAFNWRYTLRVPVESRVWELQFDDGERQRRVWHVRRLADGRYTGTADDVVGQALGESSGPAFNWRYTLRVPVDGRVWELQFDDWMYQIDADTVLNRAVMSKFGVRVGEITLAFTRAARP